MTMVTLKEILLVLCYTVSNDTRQVLSIVRSSAWLYQNLFIGISNKQFITIYRYIVLSVVVLLKD